MKELGRLLVKHRMPVRRPVATPTQNQVQTQVPAPAVNRQESNKENQSKPHVYQELDSWNSRAREIPEAVNPEESAKPKFPKGRRPYEDRSKRRSTTISVCLSAEENETIRRYAGELGINISEWIRSLVFADMGRKIPKRPKPL